jgi:AraC family transcriptional regulator
MGEYLRRFRVREACKRLGGRELTLAEIALQVGFADQSHFTRVFKRLTGLTPGEYRQTRRDEGLA